MLPYAYVCHSVWTFPPIKIVHLLWHGNAWAFLRVAESSRVVKDCWELFEGCQGCWELFKGCWGLLRVDPRLLRVLRVVWGLWRVLRVVWGLWRTVESCSRVVEDCWELSQHTCNWSQLVTTGWQPVTLVTSLNQSGWHWLNSGCGWYQSGCQLSKKREKKSVKLQLSTKKVLWPNPTQL